MIEITRPWRLSLFGPFRLFDPTGNQIRLSTRKVEALFAVIAVNRKLGIPRDEIAEILWPNRPIVSQRANFRQALATLRREVGESVLEVSRIRCHLSSQIDLITDLDNSDLRTSELFMPDHEGEWFEQIRIESHPLHGDSTQASIVSHHLQTLGWLARNDAKSMFQMLRSSASLTRGIKYGDLLRLLELTKTEPSVAGWSAYWRGSSEADLQLCTKLLRFSFSEARRQKDVELASEVCLELGKVYSRTGRFAEAEEVCNISESIAHETGTPTSRANAAWLRGTLLLHWSDRTKGIEFLVRSEDLRDNAIDQAIAKGARAFYLASTQRVEEAKDALQWTLRIAANLGHQRLDVVTGMTRAVLSTFDSSRNVAIKELEDTVRLCRAYNSTQFRVYGEELLTKLYTLEGDDRLANDRRKAAREGRSVAKMYTTPLEAKRVEAVG